MEGYLAMICFFGGNFAPRNWAFCDGQLIAISSNSALFSILGTTFGGDGRTTFGLPDFRGRAPLGTGNGPGLPQINTGQKIGDPIATMNLNQMPTHNHTASLSVGVSDRKANKSQPDGNIFANPQVNMYSSTANNSANGASLTLESTGNGKPFSIMQPYICVHFIICMMGTFPSRS